MRLRITWLPLLVCLAIACAVEARRVRIRTRPVEVEQEPVEEEEAIEEDDDNKPQSAIQYYRAQPQENIPQRSVVLVNDEDDYNGLYGQQTTPARARTDYSRQAAKSTTLAPRVKDQGSKQPPVQTIRNYNKVNDDGSFTFGYEAADGSFKEETRGTDCVVRGKYGYVDPDGNKREFTYVSGNPCDPNNPDETEEDKSDEPESNEPENVPQNYPTRTVRPIARPIQTTTHAPTTVFQNNYAHQSIRSNDQDDEQEQPESIQLLQPVHRQRVQQQQYHPQQEEVTIRQRQRVPSTTPASISYTPSQPVSITPRPTYRTPAHTLQTQPPATTYRPSLQVAVTQKPVQLQYSRPEPTSPSYTSSTRNYYPTQSPIRKPIDFAAEFQKFQQENGVSTTTPSTASTLRANAPHSSKINSQSASNPIYESQLVYDPATGQYDSALYQQLPQSEGDFSLNHRHQPYVQQYQPQFNPLYRAQPSPSPQPQQLQQQQARPVVPLPQFSQQVYQKEHENLQVLSSQQLFAQQQEQQHQQLHQDRIEAARKAAALQQQHRFQPQQQPQPQPQRQTPQGFYFVQPQQASGQIDAFLRGHNLEFN